MNNEFYVIVELGTTHVTAVAAKEYLADQYKVLAVEEAVIPEDAIRNGVITKPSVVGKIINDILFQLDFNNQSTFTFDSFYLVMGGRSLTSIEHEVSMSLTPRVPVTTADLLKLDSMAKQLTLPNRQIYGVYRKDVFLNGEPIRDAVGALGESLSATYTIVQGLPTLYDYLQTALESVEWKMKGFLLTPIANAHATLGAEDKRLGVAVVDFGATTTSLAIYHDNALRYLSVVPFGSRHITNDLTYLQILEEKAEDIKVNHTDLMMTNDEKDGTITLNPISEGLEPRLISKREISMIVDARMQEIMGYVSKEIKLSGYDKLLGSGLVIVGGGAQMKGMVDFLKSMLHLNVRMGRVHRILVEGSEEYNLLKFIPAIGGFCSAPNCGKLVDAETVTKSAKKPSMPKASKRKFKDKMVDGLVGIFKESDM